MLLFTRSLLTKRFYLMPNERFIFTRSQSRNCFLLFFFLRLLTMRQTFQFACSLSYDMWFCLLTIKKMFLFLSWNERSHARHCSLFSACVLSNQRFFLLCCRIEHSSSISWKRFLSVCWNERCQMRHYSPRQKKHGFWRFFHVQTNVSLPLGGMNVDRSHTNMTISKRFLFAW